MTYVVLKLHTVSIVLPDLFEEVEEENGHEIANRAGRNLCGAFRH